MSKTDWRKGEGVLRHHHNCDEHGCFPSPTPDAVRLTISITVPLSASLWDTSDWLTAEERAEMTPAEIDEALSRGTPRGQAESWLDYASGWYYVPEDEGVVYEVVSVEHLAAGEVVPDP